MAAVSSSQTETKSKNKAKAKPRTEKSLGVRFIRGRVYDSQNGKSCHQCRQKTLDFAASCKNKSENKQCTFHFCHKCLLNRYGEKAEEMAVLDDWMCPKCRGICNCSFCMKKRGYHPTGSLVHTAKAKGFSSVLEMLRVEGSETLDSEKSLSRVSKASASSKKEETTNEVLDLKKGQPEQLLREIACGRRQRRAQDSPIVRFHMQLLSMIQKDPLKGYPSLNQTTAGESWLHSLTKYISESQYLSEEMQMDSFDVNGDGYDILDSSKKLRILNFLCDEVLGTEDFRSWIDVQNSEREKKAKENVLAEKEKREKVRNIKKKLQDEMAGAILLKMGTPLSIAEHEDLVSKINLEAAQILEETLEARDVVFDKEQQSDAVRSEPIFLDEHGRKFWILRFYSEKRDILLQDVRRGELVSVPERWYSYDVEQKAIVTEYVSSLRKLKK